MSEGVRITAGIALPALIFSYFGFVSQGILMSLGALCISISDTPGPVIHRFYGMLFCNFIICVVYIIISYVTAFPIILALLLLIFGFLFSMLTVYGVRISSIGIAAMLIMILSFENPIHGNIIWLNVMYILGGGIWYMLFSLALYTIRPYKIIQQILGDFIIEIGEYLQLRGAFYQDNPDYEKTYKLLLEQQVQIQRQQSLLSDMLFKTRAIIRESTHKGKVLLKIYIDVAELFESIMTGFSDYTVLHQQFDATGILHKIGNHVITLTQEMKAIGLAVKSGQHSFAENDIIASAKELKTQFEDLRKTFMNDNNLDDFISLGRIVNNVQYLTEKINGLHYYTSFDKKIKTVSKELVEQSNFSESQDLRPALFFNNLNFQSNIFKHSIRVTIALLVGYLVSLFFKIGHSYWILLTIVVILKPAYSLTKQRNKDRLFGTVLGIILGVIILYFIKDKTILLIIMLFFMVASYTFIRTNYFIMVLALTPYLVIFFHFLYGTSLRLVLADRMIDTAIGSVIAFVASIFFIPAWEHTTIKTYLLKMLDADIHYFEQIAKAYSSENKLVLKDLKLVRRNLLTALANVSDAFNRMLSEPKRFQKNSTHVHQFVVLSHILTSHFATLSYFLNVTENRFRSEDLLPVIENTQRSLLSAVHYLEQKEGEPDTADVDSLTKINEQARSLLEKRKEEILIRKLETNTKQQLVEVKSVIDQFNFIYNIAADIAKCSRAIGKA